MRFEIDFLGRAYLANLCRERAAACRAKAEGTRVPRMKDELIAEARYGEVQAEMLDAGEAEPDMSKVTKIEELGVREQMVAGTEQQSPS